MPAYTYSTTHTNNKIKMLKSYVPCNISSSRQDDRARLAMHQHQKLRAQPVDKLDKNAET